MSSKLGSLVVKMVTGSYLYGTNTDDSDHDFKEIRLPTPQDIILQQAFKVVHHQTKEDPTKRNTYDDVDIEVFSLQHFTNMLHRGDTGALDMLFAPDSMILESSPLWETIQMHRPMLICSKSAGFIGYCKQQANKYGIKGSRVAATDQIVALLSRAIEVHGPMEKLSALDTELKDFVLRVQHAEITAIEVQPDREVMHLSVCNRKMPYTTTLKECLRTYSSLQTEYGHRARQAAGEDNVDWKALYHAVRVGQESLELLTYHHITLPRPEFDYLKRIKLGRVPYAEVAELIDDLLVRIELAAKMSTLPAEINRVLVDSLVLTAYHSSIRP